MILAAPSRSRIRSSQTADLRAERFLRHEAGVSAGTEPPSLLDRMESWNTLFMERFETWGVLERPYVNERRINGRWPLAARPYVMP